MCFTLRWINYEQLHTCLNYIHKLDGREETQVDPIYFEINFVDTLMKPSTLPTKLPTLYWAEREGQGKGIMGSWLVAESTFYFL